MCGSCQTGHHNAEGHAVGTKDSWTNERIESSMCTDAIGEKMELHGKEMTVVQCYGNYYHYYFEILRRSKR